ncbi:type I polyketide synthase, partial [Streptomyces sp. NPDC056652]|uniref:type I polyketide synthase n=1 Tax=Streptomyces sp. NPDC056652 TaxID=3345893 RepID=UPI0036AFCA6F
ISAHPVLAIPLTDATTPHHGTTTHTLTRNNGTPVQLLRSLITLHTHGHPTNWHHVFPGQTTAPIPGLPTYPFQHQHYWLEQEGRQGDPASLGLDAFRHPWLGAATAVADGDNGHLLTGRLSPVEQSWLADHAVFGTAIAPGTALLELAWTAAAEVGAGHVAELTIAEPLVLPESGNVRIQVTVGHTGTDGRRSIALYSRREDTQSDWTCHATGVLAEGQPRGEEAVRAGFAELAQWPVPGAESVDVDAFYERFREQGLSYGPAFRGLNDLRLRGRSAFATVRLPEGLDASDYGMHPALLDAALQALAAVRTAGVESGSVLLPFEWSAAELYRVGSTELRVRADWDQDTAEARIWVADSAGAPVAHARLQARVATAEQIRAAEPVEHLYRVDVQAVPLPDAAVDGGGVWSLGGRGELAGALAARHVADVDELFARLAQDEGARPARLVLDVTVPCEEADAARAAREVSEFALEVLRRTLADERLARAELVWVTRRAVGGDVRDLARAPLWGVLRVARNEYPDRVIRAVDLGEAAEDLGVLPRVLSLTAEREVIVRQGLAGVPRLVRVESARSVEVRRLDSEGVVLVTGGTGELGRQLAHHLVRHHDARHLVLTSRQGPDAPGADDLADELRESGAVSVDIRACDIGDEQQATALIGGLDRPLTAVYHLAGVLDDGLITGQNPERLARVLAPKADGALHLHRLTQTHDLAAFVLFSSAAGILGGPGQSTYAAANTFLDALAHHRRAQGLPATSLAWGLWQLAGIGMTSHLGEAELSRMRRQGITALTETQGMRLLDASLAQPHAHLVPVRLDLATLRREQDRGGEVPGLLRALVRARRSRASETEQSPDALRDRLLALPEGDRPEVVTELVRREVAAVLGVADASGVGPRQVLKELGIDSVMAVELRRRLAAETGVSLPATLAFDYPTPAAITELLLSRMELGGVPAGAKAARVTKDQINEFVELLRSATPELLESEGLVPRLLDMQTALAKTVAAPGEPEVDIEDSSQEDLLEFLDRKFGVSK